MKPVYKLMMLKWISRLFGKTERLEQTKSTKEDYKTMLEMPELISRIEYHEGLRLEPYRCTRGKLTIGIGRCIDTNPFTTQELIAIGDWGHGITKAMAYMLCKNDIIRCIDGLRKNVPFFDKLDNERQYALIDMCFQLGIDGLLKFKKMLSAMGAGNYQEASRQCLDSDYAKQTTRRANEIANCIEKGRFEKWNG